MTDYDATIAHMKLAAMRELRKRAAAPFSIRQGDLPGFYEETLDAVVGQFAEKLMAALMDRDNWKRSAETLGEELEVETNRLGYVQGQLEDERQAVRRRDGWLHEKDAQIRKLQEDLEFADEQAS